MPGPSSRAPSAYDPRYHPQRSRARRDQVLNRMVETGYLTADQAQAASTTPVLAVPPPSGGSCQ